MKRSFISQRCMVLALVLFAAVNSAFPQEQRSPGNGASRQSELELSRPVRPWEFLDAVGQRAALFGRESGEIEGWIYPLKVFRGFQLRFHTASGIFPARDQARQLIVHPEGPSIVYSTASFEVRESFIMPPSEP